MPQAPTSVHTRWIAEHQAMQEGEPRDTLKKRHDGGMLVEALLVRPPGLQRAAGHLKRLGRLTLGEPLGLQSAILLKELSAFECDPSVGGDHRCLVAAYWMTVPTATSFVILRLGMHDG